MKIAGMVAVSNFPYAITHIRKLCEICDEVYIRYDAIRGDPEHLLALNKMAEQPDSKIKHIQIVNEQWRVPHWREDCLIMIPANTDIVLCPDEDEVFGDGIKEELMAFYNSTKLGMMFSYEPLVADDGRTINGGMPYPPEPHMKAFKFQVGLSYWPYHGNAIIAKYHSPDCWWNANTKIKHYCCFTKAMEDAKKFRSDTPKSKGVKAVTIVGFGPSAQKLNEQNTIGEVWSLNDCYQGFSPQLLRATTRIFDLHMPHKREHLPAKDGREHFWHLDQLGRRGHRIILQKPHPLVYGSEAYPIYKVLSHFGLRYFTGSCAYLIPMAILEGYTHIAIFGFDQKDWEHIRQRESFVFWIGVAMGQGIQFSGELTFLNDCKRMYGYEWGPEWDEQANRDLWDPFPFEVKMKEKTQASAGELHGNWK